jgi:hypothetical protein
VTLLLREVVRFVAEAGLWLLALGLVTGLCAAAVMFLIERRITPRDVGLALATGALSAAIAHRLGLTLFAPPVGGRPLPVLWAALGATGLALLSIKRRSRSDP